jgi:hypothetical protein
LYDPNFSKTPQFREMEIKCQLLDAGWTYNEIESTDLDELMKLLAFKDAVKEHQDLKYLDDNTMF